MRTSWYCPILSGLDLIESSFHIIDFVDLHVINPMPQSVEKFISSILLKLKMHICLDRSWNNLAAGELKKPYLETLKW